MYSSEIVLDRGRPSICLERELFVTGRQFGKRVLLRPECQKIGMHRKRRPQFFKSSGMVTPTEAAVDEICAQLSGSIGMPRASRTWRVASSNSPGSSTGASGSTGGDDFVHATRRSM